MRTTLTLDDDVAAMLERLRKKRGQNLKDLVNEALRFGLKQIESPPPEDRKRFRTRTVDLGPCLIGNLDNVAEALAIAEGEDFK